MIQKTSESKYECRESKLTDTVIKLNKEGLYVEHGFLKNGYYHLNVIKTQKKKRFNQIFKNKIGIK